MSPRDMKGSVGIESELWLGPYNLEQFLRRPLRGQLRMLAPMLHAVARLLHDGNFGFTAGLAAGAKTRY